MKKAFLYISIPIFVTLLFSITVFSYFIPDQHPKNKNNNLLTKTLYIVRHAKSNHDNPNLKDFDRPLEPKGETNAKAVGELLSKKKIEFDQIISSPSKRTYETAKIICKEIRYKITDVKLNSVIYGCTLATYLDIIKSIDDKYQNVMVIGHNPATTELANYLQIEKAIPEVPTAGIVAIEFNISSWKDIGSSSGRLLFFHDPDNINKNSD